jgi:hypothetical protein
MLRAAEIGVINPQLIPISRLICPFFVFTNHMMNKQNSDHSFNAFICLFGYILSKTVVNFPMYFRYLINRGANNLANEWEFKREFIFDTIISFGFGYVNRDINNINYSTMGSLAVAINLLAYGPIIIDAYMNRFGDMDVQRAL